MAIGVGSAMKEIHIDLRKNMPWAHAASGGRLVWAIGHAFLHGSFMDNRGLLELFSKDSHFHFRRYLELTKRLNGNFAVIIKDEGAVFASVDRVRSFPLFYSLKGDTFIIGDDAHSIQKRAGFNTLDKDSAREFLLSGYICGKDTLIPEIRQLEPAEFLYLDLKEGSDILRERYYSYYNKDKMQLSAEVMAEIHDKILSSVFQRLLKSIGERKVVVPLSGGVDSRLVASMLKRLNYENVVCLSYGVPNNWETNFSKKIADRLGYEWIYVPYSREKWHKIYRSREWRDFFYSYDNLSSLPNMSEWCAVRELKEKGLVPEDALFVPGHTGDFISGGHLQYVFAGKGQITKEVLLNRILEKHYSLWKKELSNKDARKRIMNKLWEFFKGMPLSSESDIADAYECWEWQARQARFIINSVRTYDFYGYEWRLPLWDLEMMDFWCTVPLELKLGKKLYLFYLKEKDELNLFGENLERKQLHKRRVIGGIARKFIEYFRDTNALCGIHNYFTVSFLNAGRKNINSILVKEYLKKIKSELAL